MVRNGKKWIEMGFGGYILDVLKHTQLPSASQKLAIGTPHSYFVYTGHGLSANQQPWATVAMVAPPLLLFVTCCYFFHLG